MTYEFTELGVEATDVLLAEAVGGGGDDPDELRAPGARRAVFVGDVLVLVEDLQAHDAPARLDRANLLDFEQPS